MKLNKSHRSNIIFVIIFAVIFFTPLRGYIQVFVSQIKMSILSPSVEDVDSRIKLTNYNWNLKGINTNDLKFVDAKEKVIIVNFWATWCPPCRAEMPSLQKLYDDYKDKIEFIFVTNENSDTVTRFLEKNNYTLPSFNQYTNTPKEFNVSSIPATYIINKKGEIVVHEVGAADWNSKAIRVILDELLEN